MQSPNNRQVLDIHLLLLTLPTPHPTTLLTHSLVIFAIDHRRSHWAFNTLDLWPLNAQRLHGGGSCCHYWHNFKMAHVNSYLFISPSREATYCAAQSVSLIVFSPLRLFFPSFSSLSRLARNCSVLGCTMVFVQLCCFCNLVGITVG